MEAYLIIILLVCIMIPIILYFVFKNGPKIKYSKKSSPIKPSVINKKNNTKVRHSLSEWFWIIVFALIAIRILWWFIMQVISYL